MVMLTYASSLDGVGMARFEEDRIQQMVLNELISAFMAAGAYNQRTRTKGSFG
jgi:hypothetical protein